MFYFSSFLVFLYTLYFLSFCSFFSIFHRILFMSSNAFYHLDIRLFIYIPMSKPNQPNKKDDGIPEYDMRDTTIYRCFICLWWSHLKKCSSREKCPNRSNQVKFTNISKTKKTTHTGQFPKECPYWSNSEIAVWPNSEKMSILVKLSSASIWITVMLFKSVCQLTMKV